jgi:cellulose synthase/poly-beta-1,6-N-acetylglucosamine synthase-like glycosyltransferase
MQSVLSVIVPAYNAGPYLARCLQALRDGDHAPLEIIVSDDGSSDETIEIAEQFGATVLHSDERHGPSFARNRAAAFAKGSVLLFLDSDVCVHHNTLSKFEVAFAADSALDALIGSYDSSPGSPDFISQYRNLMHAYVHQTGAEQASTFWSGCGAIRTSVFREHSGFVEDYGRPAIEDIELGYRLVRAHHKIVLDRTILATHMKRWTFWGLLKTDILDRAIPWTELILRDRLMPDDLNLQLSQRVSVALVFVLIALCAMIAAVSGIYMLIPLLAIAFLMLARWWGEFGSYDRPRRAFAMLMGVIAVVAAIAYAHRMYGIIPPLIVTPVLLLLRHRYGTNGKLKQPQRWVGIIFLALSLAVAIWYLPAHHLLLACFAIILLLGIMNSQFYIFLAGKRGIAFMLAAIPFHLLYHFYSGLSFVAGAARHYSAAGSIDGAVIRLTTVPGSDHSQPSQPIKEPAK